MIFDNSKTEKNIINYIKKKKNLINKFNFKKEINYGCKNKLLN